HPGRWYPRGEGHRVFRSQIECEGCGLVECIERQMECIKRISANEVLDACREVLRGKAESLKTQSENTQNLKHGKHLVDVV
ncbi:MAG TPA: hypothetical protein DCO65_01465, partial [Spartobacteria bacterium]|nr:hypothetical protein [Spartobacteria bacterium]